MKAAKYNDYTDVNVNNLKRLDAVYCTDKIEQHYWTADTLIKKLQEYPAAATISFDKEYTYYDDYQVLIEVSYSRPETDEEFDKRKTLQQRQIFNLYKANQAKIELKKKSEEKVLFVQLADKFGVVLPDSFKD